MVWPLDSLIKKLAKIVCMGGNLLLNLASKAAGEIEQVKRLKEKGTWLKINGKSIYGTRGEPIDYNNNWCGSIKKISFIYML